MNPISPIRPVTSVYLDPHQARERPATAHEDLLGDSIERAYAAGLYELDALLAYLNKAGPLGPNGQAWTPDSLKAEMARLGR